MLFSERDGKPIMEWWSVILNTVDHCAMGKGQAVDFNYGRQITKRLHCVSTLVRKVYHSTSSKRSYELADLKVNSSHLLALQSQEDKVSGSSVKGPSHSFPKFIQRASV